MGINISCALAGLTLFRLPHCEIWAQKSRSRVRRLQWIRVCTNFSIPSDSLHGTIKDWVLLGGLHWVTLGGGGYWGQRADQRLLTGISDRQHCPGWWCGDFNAGRAETRPWAQCRVSHLIILSYTRPIITVRPVEASHWSIYDIAGLWLAEIKKAAESWGIIQCFYS